MTIKRYGYCKKMTAKELLEICRKHAILKAIKQVRA